MPTQSDKARLLALVSSHIHYQAGEFIIALSEENVPSGAVRITFETWACCGCCSCCPPNPCRTNPKFVLKVSADGIVEFESDGYLDSLDEKELLMIRPIVYQIVSQWQAQRAADARNPHQSTVDAPEQQGMQLCSVADEIEKLVSLKERGHLSDAEFDAAKTKLLQSPLLP